LRPAPAAFPCRFRVSAPTRILSDIHFGDRASRVRRLAQLRPLCDEIGTLVLNGDTLDTRPGPPPAATAALRDEVLAFFRQAAPGTVFLTGNHDADISTQHLADLDDGRVFVVHGDIQFADIVPWGRDASHIARALAAELAVVDPALREDLATRLAVWRRVAGQIPQRHQSERNGLKYALHFAADTIWPPTRVLRILRAWRDEPSHAAELLRRHRPGAQFMLAGHTHRPGWWRLPNGAVLINTGSFCPPLGGYAVDLLPGRLVVRRVELRRREFRVGRVVAEFPLAAT
jgi:predicted phosphodiesterase